MLAITLFNSSMGGHVRGSICLSISGTRAAVIKILLDLVWGTMATRGENMCITGFGQLSFRCESGELCGSPDSQVKTSIFKQEFSGVDYGFFIPPSAKWTISLNLCSV